VIDDNASILWNFADVSTQDTLTEYAKPIDSRGDKTQALLMLSTFHLDLHIGKIDSVQSRTATAINCNFLGSQQAILQQEENSLVKAEILVISCPKISV
jgi:hypothetical protein